MAYDVHYYLNVKEAMKKAVFISVLFIHLLYLVFMIRLQEKHMKKGVNFDYLQDAQARVTKSLVSYGTEVYSN